MLIFSHYIIKYHKGVILFLTNQRFLSFLFCFYSLLFSLPFLISSFFSFTSKFLSKTLSRVLETMLKERRSLSKQEAGWQEPSRSTGDLCQLPGQKGPLRRRRLPAPAVLPDTILRTEEPGGLQSMGSQRVRHDLANKRQLQAEMPTNPDTFKKLSSSYFLHIADRGLESRSNLKLEFILP